jgi:hypothetical protein
MKKLPVLDIIIVLIASKLTVFEHLTRRNGWYYAVLAAAFAASVAIRYFYKGKKD